MNTTSHWFKGHLRDMPRDECFQLLESRQVGRIGFVDPDGPVVLPVNYVIHGESVLIATLPGNSISNAVGQPVAFEVDEIDEFNETGSSVLVRGLASVVAKDELPDEQEQPNPWAEGDRSLVIRITATQVTGRYLLPA